MDISKPQSAKQLKEHLQHNQEPFSLQSYLVERNYMFNNFSFDSGTFHHLYSAKNLKWSIKYDLNKIRKRLLDATGILRSLLYKFIPTIDDHEFSNWHEEHNSGLYYVHDLKTHTQTISQTNSLTTLAVSDHFSNKDVQDKVWPANMFQTFTLPKLRRSEVDTGTKPPWISSKENRQHYSRGPEWNAGIGRVCHLTISDGEVRAVPTLSQRLVSDYVRKLLVKSNILKFRRAKKDKVQEMIETACLCGWSVPKKKQLRFEYGEKDRGFHEKVSTKAISESQEFQSIIDEHFNLLKKQYRQVKKISQVLYAESRVISEEWKSLQIVNWEIYMEIGDSITEDIVSEIIDLF